MSDPSSQVRCSTVTRQAKVDPIGTAGSYAGFLLIEIDLPWPPEIAEMSLVAPIVDEAKRWGVRVQALAPRTDSSDRRVLYYRWNEQIGRFEGTEVLTNDPVGTARGLLAGDRPAEARELSGITDVLICGHGRRDRCCGSMGTALQLSFSGSELPAGVRVWRTSHTGGHRFAPTGLVLPWGGCWAYLDLAMLQQVVTLSGPTSSVAARYRGTCGLGSPAIQALESAVLANVGWRLFGWQRSAEELGDGLVELTATTRSGNRTWRGRVGVNRTLPIPSCGTPINGTEKTEEELTVLEFDEVTREAPAGTTESRKGPALPAAHVQGIGPRRTL